MSIYYDTLKNWTSNDYLKEKALYLKNIYGNNVTKWRCPTFNTLDQYDWKTDNDPVVNQLIEKLTSEVYEFSKMFGIQESCNKLKCSGFWFNVADQGDYQEYHQHSNSHFSLVYYVDVEKNSGNITFRSFESMFDMYTFPLSETNLTDLSYKTCSYQPINQTFLIFKSNTLHMVEKNQNSKPRISISMNFIFEN
jgi:uncharacterized protein (TIGR02466 family)